MTITKYSSNGHYRFLHSLMVVSSLGLPTFPNYQSTPYQNLKVGFPTLFVTKPLQNKTQKWDFPLGNRAMSNTVHTAANDGTAPTLNVMNT